MANTTLMMIKPDAVENGHIGNILEKVTSAGFSIRALKLTQLTLNDAEAFYAVHKERPFFGELVAFMTRGPIVAAVLEKENQKKQYEENLRQERDQQIKQEIFENSQRLTNDLIKNQIDKSKTQRASEDLMNLENQLQEAINQRDKTNFYLKHSGLFGQRRNSPSYTSVIPQSSFGPSSTYAQPEYYSGDPFEIKRLYE